MSDIYPTVVCHQQNIDLGVKVDRLEEIENINKRQNILNQISSPYHEVLDEPIKWDKCEILKSENK